ncbi:MAG: ABC transporter permease subunit, partial [Eubacterium sp.]
MLNIPLLKKSFKVNLKVLLIFSVVLALYLSIIIGMYDPASLDNMAKMLELLPKQMVSALNFNLASNNSLDGFIASYFYGFLIFLVPMVFNIIVSNGLIAKYVDQGSMAYLLSVPNSRGKVVRTQAMVLILDNVILMSCVTVLGIVISAIMFPGDLDVGLFFKINAGALLLQLAISSIGFFFSCLFSDTRYSLGFGAGIPILFLLIQMLGDVGDKLKNLK